MDIYSQLNNELTLQENSHEFIRSSFNHAAVISIQLLYIIIATASCSEFMKSQLIKGKVREEF